MEPLESLDPLCLPAANDRTFVFRVEDSDGIRDIFTACTELCFCAVALTSDETAEPRSTEALLLTGADDVGVTVWEVERDEGRGILEILDVLCPSTFLALPWNLVPSDSLEAVLLVAADNVGVMLSDCGREYGPRILEMLSLVKLAVALGTRDRSESHDSFRVGVADRVGVMLPDGGRAEKLGLLVFPFGGCGKEATLMGLRKVFPEGLDSLVVATETDLIVGIFDVE